MVPGLASKFVAPSAVVASTCATRMPLPSTFVVTARNKVRPTMFKSCAVAVRQNKMVQMKIAGAFRRDNWFMIMLGAKFPRKPYLIAR